MIIMTRGCLQTKIIVASSKFKVIHNILTMFIGCNKSLLYPASNFVLHGGISKFTWQDICCK